jgi:hypothetical protein
MANPLEKRTVKVGKEDHTFENIEHLEARIKLRYKTLTQYKSLDESDFDDSIIRDVTRIAEQLVELIDHHAAWTVEIDKFQEAQSKERRANLLRAIHDLPPDPFA